MYYFVRLRVCVNLSLHISFHGCEQGADFIGSAYAEHTGFNSWAEANNIIVLYPYIAASNSLPTNPNGYAKQLNAR